MTFPIKAELLVELGNWQRGLNQANKKLDGFGKSMKTISNGVKAAWAGIAVGVVGQLYDGIVDVTKAAAEDNKSMALLNEQMKRTWKGNDKLNASIDAQIDAMSNATGIADDKLRPALIRIAAVTKSPAKGMKLLSLSADIAAKSGSDLTLVSKNMAKFLGGNKTALDKLVPGLSSAGNRMEYLVKNYEGFSEIAGQNDPFGRITVTVDNFKEKLGKAFLPLANSFADWLAGPEAQAQLDMIAGRVKDAFAWLNSAEGKKTIGEWYDRTKALVDLLVQMVDGLLEFISKMPGQKSKGQTSWEAKVATGGTDFVTKADGTQQGYWSAAKAYQFQAAKMNNSPNIVVNMKVENDPITGKSVVKLLRSEAGSRGISVGKMITQ